MEIYKDLNSKATKEFENLLNSQLSKAKIEEGQVIEGTVTKITNKYVFLFVEGLKPEPVLDLNELKILNISDKVKEGFKISVLLEKIEDKNGDVIVSATSSALGYIESAEDFLFDRGRWRLLGRVWKSSRRNGRRARGLRQGRLPRGLRGAGLPRLQPGNETAGPRSYCQYRFHGGLDSFPGNGQLQRQQSGGGGPVGNHAVRAGPLWHWHHGSVPRLLPDQSGGIHPLTGLPRPGTRE